MYIPEKVLIVLIATELRSDKSFNVSHTRRYIFVNNIYCYNMLFHRENNIVYLLREGLSYVTMLHLGF